MFDNIKKALAKAAPWFCYVEEVPPREEEAKKPSAIGNFVKGAVETVKEYVTVENVKAYASESLFEGTPCDMVVPMQVGKAVVTAASHTAALSVVNGFVRLCTKDSKNPIAKAVSHVVGSVIAEKIVVPFVKDNWLMPQYDDACKWLVDTMTIDMTCQPRDAEILKTFRDGQEAILSGIEPKDQNAYCMAREKVINAAYPTDDEQNMAFVECHGDVDSMACRAFDRIMGDVCSDNLFVQEFWCKPVAEQKWFIKIKNWCQKTKACFCGAPKEAMA